MLIISSLWYLILPFDFSLIRTIGPAFPVIRIGSKGIGPQIMRIMQ